MYSKSIIVGNLGGPPEARYLPDGTMVCNFSVATNRRWTDRNTGQPVDETTWYRVSVFGSQAENANQYLAKGSKVLVEGRLTPDPATGGPRTFTRQDGTVGASYELRAFTVQYLSTKAETEDLRSQNGSAPVPAGAPATQGSHRPPAAPEEDDIPF